MVFSTSLLDKTNVRSIQEIIPHPEYKAESSSALFPNNDIAILTFEGGLPPGYEPAVLNSQISVVAGQAITLVGYGKDEHGDYPELLKKTSVKVTEISDTEFRTDESKSGTCSGDSGSPAYSQADNRIFLSGLVSRGDNACKEFGIYTSVNASEA